MEQVTLGQHYFILYQKRDIANRQKKRSRESNLIYKVSVSTRIVILKSVLLTCGGTIMVKYWLDLMLIELRYYFLCTEMFIVYLRDLKREYSCAPQIDTWLLISHRTVKCFVYLSLSLLNHFWNLGKLVSLEFYSYFLFFFSANNPFKR